MIKYLSVIGLNNIINNKGIKIIKNECRNSCNVNIFSFDKILLFIINFLNKTKNIVNNLINSIKYNKISKNKYPVSNVEDII